MLLACLTALPVAAQVTLTGHVRDAVSMQPIPAVHVYATGQQVGTITNRSGRFELAVARLPVQLTIRHLGYEEHTLRVEPNGPRDFTVDLHEAVYQFGEVVVAGEDFAANLMRRVIEAKQARRARLRTWQANGYSRITLQNQARIVLVAEHGFNAYRDAQRGPREVIRSRRTSSDFYQELGLDPIPVDFYQDYAFVQGLSFLGPTHPQALEHYTFTFAGSRVFEGRTVYDLHIAPRASTQAAFIGSIAVLDSAYAVLEVDLRPARHVEFRPEVKRWNVAYSQHFTPVDSFWLPMGLLAEGDFHIDPDDSGIGPGRLQYTALLQKHTVNEPLPQGPYAQDEQLVMDEASIVKDDLFLLSETVVALGPEEVAAFSDLQRERLVLRRALPGGVMARAPRVMARDTPPGEAPQFVMPLLWGVEPWVRYNRVDGYFVGVGWSLGTHGFGLGGRLGKNTADNKTQFSLRLSSWMNPRLHVTFWGGRETAPLRPSRYYGMPLNSLAAQLGRGDYFDYVWKRWGGVRAAYVTGALRVGVDLRLEHHKSRDRSLKQAWPFARKFGENPAIERARWTTVEVTAALGDDWRPVRMRPLRRAEVRVLAGRSNKDTAQAFGRYELWLDYYVKTLQRGRPRPMGLALRAMHAGAFGAAQPQGRAALDGSMGPVAPTGTLRSLRDMRYLGRRAMGVYWEHDFRTVLWEFLGIQPLVRRQTGITIGGAHARMWPEPDGFHHELTLSLTEVWGTPFRVDLTRRLDVPGWFVSLGLSRTINVSRYIP